MIDWNKEDVEHGVKAFGVCLSSLDQDRPILVGALSQTADGIPPAAAERPFFPPPCVRISDV